MARVHTRVNSGIQRVTDLATAEGMKGRMRARLDTAGVDMKALAREADYPYRSVVRYLNEETTVPADFVAAFARVVPTSLRWLLLDVGTPDPEPLQPSEAERVLEDVRRLIEGRTTVKRPALPAVPLEPEPRPSQSGGSSSSSRSQSPSSTES